MSYIWPVALIVASNVVYQICAKEVPAAMDPFAALSVTYGVGAAVSLVFYFLLNRGGDLMGEYARINWAPVVLGLVIVGLEVGYIFAYKAGWPVNTAALVQSAFLAIALLAVGALVYHEPVTRDKVLGVVICLVGLGFLSR